MREESEMGVLLMSTTPFQMNWLSLVRQDYPLCGTELKLLFINMKDVLLGDY